MPRAFSAALIVACTLSLLGSSACQTDARPNCTRMRACCAALRGVEDGLPKEHEILCAHDPELDEGCAETVKDIARFTPQKRLPPACTIAQ